MFQKLEAQKAILMKRDFTITSICKHIKGQTSKLIVDKNIKMGLVD